MDPVLDDTTDSAWNGLLNQANSSVQHPVEFTYSFIPSGVSINPAGVSGYGPSNATSVALPDLPFYVNDWTFTVNNDLSYTATCTELNVFQQVQLAFDWWSSCLMQATGVQVTFRSLGTESADSPHGATVSSLISRTDRNQYNIGDIRICAWDFTGTSFDQALMYCFPAGPSNITYEQKTYINKPDLAGNIYINSSIYWRNTLMPSNSQSFVLSTASRASDNTALCGYDFAHTFAHELGHAFGLAHDCDNNKNANDGFHSCGDVPGNGESTMMPTATLLDFLRNSCNGWVLHHIENIYSTGNTNNSALSNAIKPAESPKPVICPKKDLDANDLRAVKFTSK